MRITFVVNSLVYGGAETQLIALTRELSARGHAVLIYTLRDDNPRLGELAGSDVQVIADRKQGRFDVGLIFRIRKAIRTFQADIVHGFLLDGNLHARLAAAGTGIPALNSERSSDYDVPLPHRVGLALTRRLTCGIVANTHAGGLFAQKLFRLPSKHVHVVWNGIAYDDAGYVAAPRIGLGEEFFGRADVKVACLVGMLRPEKDQRLALRVAAALLERDPSWRVLLVGDSLPQTMAYKAAVMQLHRELALGSAVVFAGLRQNVKQIVRRSNVMFCTSTNEGFPNVVLEAMSVGTPIVSTDYSDIRLILPRDWQVVGTRTPTDLADAIIRADAERRVLGDEQRRWLRANGTIEMAASRLEHVYSRYTNAVATPERHQSPAVAAGVTR